MAIHMQITFRTLCLTKMHRNPDGYESRIRIRVRVRTTSMPMEGGLGWHTCGSAGYSLPLILCFLCGLAATKLIAKWDYIPHFHLHFPGKSAKRMPILIYGCGWGSNCMAKN